MRSYPVNRKPYREKGNGPDCEFICELPNGVHARPASHVETLCNTFSSQIEWHNLRTDRKGNAKSALALIGTDTLVGDNCQLLISGADEQEAYQRLSQWLRDEFPTATHRWRK